MSEHVERRIKHLEEDHHRLDKKIDGLESTGIFDDVELTDLKKQRLQVKTKIVTLKQEHLKPVYKTKSND